MAPSPAALAKPTADSYPSRKLMDAVGLKLTSLEANSQHFNFLANSRQGARIKHQRALGQGLPLWVDRSP